MSSRNAEHGWYAETLEGRIAVLARYGAGSAFITDDERERERVRRLTRKHRHLRGVRVLSAQQAAAEAIWGER